MLVGLHFFSEQPKPHCVHYRLITTRRFTVLRTVTLMVTVAFAIQPPPYKYPNILYVGFKPQKQFFCNADVCEDYKCGLGCPHLYYMLKFLVCTPQFLGNTLQFFAVIEWWFKHSPHPHSSRLTQVSGLGR